MNKSKIFFVHTHKLKKHTKKYYHNVDILVVCFIIKKTTTDYSGPISNEERNEIDSECKRFSKLMEKSWEGQLSDSVWSTLDGRFAQMVFFTFNVFSFIETLCSVFVVFLNKI